MTAIPLKLAEFVHPVFVARSRHRTVTNTIPKMENVKIELRGDWIVVEDESRGEEHWMPAQSVVRLEPLHHGKGMACSTKCSTTEQPKRGRPKKK